MRNPNPVRRYVVALVDQAGRDAHIYLLLIRPRLEVHQGSGSGICNPLPHDRESLFVLVVVLCDNLTTVGGLGLRRDEYGGERIVEFERSPNRLCETVIRQDIVVVLCEHMIVPMKRESPNVRYRYDYMARCRWQNGAIVGHQCLVNRLQNRLVNDFLNDGSRYDRSIFGC